MTRKHPLEPLSKLLQTISPLPRLEILLVIGAGEACVCHLEAFLGYRQAYISQHLMALRQAGVLDDRRDGRYVYYCLHDPGLLDLILLAANLQRVDLPAFKPDGCACPTCESLEGN